MAKKNKVEYICTNCGFKYPKLLGKCHNCNEWNTFVEHIEEPNVPSPTNKVCIKGVSKAKTLKSVKANAIPRIATGMEEFDRVMGGGIVVDSVTILTAPPGTGKSTLILQVAQLIADKGLKVLYASGEESETQIKSRADRILPSLNDNLYIVADNNFENVVSDIEKINPNLIILDSIGTFGVSHISSRIGSPSQMMECANIITKIAKNKENPKAVVMIGQMTKEDELKGPRELEHLVDTVLHLESLDDVKKIARCSKNRFGEIETGLFEMDGDGLTEVKDASKLFITERDEEDVVYGTALSVIREGTRPLIIEVESSVSKSFAPYPSRIAEGLKKDNLNILISILEQSAGINLWDKNVYVKPTGGLKIEETSVNLSVLMSIASSFYKKPVPNGTLFIGEVGLTGELKKVQSIDSRIKEAQRMGFKEIVMPNQPLKPDTEKLAIKITKMKHIKNTIDYLLK